jgi:AbrB family looped-hinge helix DNA binding protein
MPAATLTAKGQVVIPADIRARYGLVAGTQIEFVDDGSALRLVVRRRVQPSSMEAGFGMIRLPKTGRQRKLSEFDAADLLRRRS